jgi:hypothetical protein
MSSLPHGRPFGDPPPWSADEEFADDGGLTPWSAQEIKLRPDVGTITGGQIPDKRILARHANFKDHDFARRAANIDLLEAMNFPDPWGNADPINDSGTGINPTELVCWRGASGHPMYAVAGGENVLKDSRGGYNWGADRTDAGDTFQAVAENRFNVCAIRTNGGASALSARGLATSWGGQSIDASSDYRAIEADHSLAEAVSPESVFWIAGLDSTGPVAKVIRASFGDGTGIPGTLVSYAGIGTHRLDLIAVRGGSGLAAASFASTGGVLFAWSDGDNALTARTSPTSAAILDLLWCPDGTATGGAYFLFTLNEVWRSPDGTNGSWIDMSSFLPPGAAFYLRGGCVRGSLIVVPGLAGVIGGTDNSILITGDGAETWDVIPEPLTRIGGSPTPITKKIRNLGNRLAAFGYAAAGNVHVAYGLRAGRFVR